MSRVSKLALIVVASLLVLGGAFLWALPEIVRRVALHQIPKHTGRPAAIEDIDLNLFTGHLAIKRFRLAERVGSEPFVEFERLDLRLSLPALVRSHIRVKEIALASPSARVVRTGPSEFNFSDLLRRPPAPEPAREGTSRPWTITLERVRVADGRVRIHDQAVKPASDWTVEDLAVEVDRVTTTSGAPPGRVAVRTRIDEARLDVTADPLRLDPVLGQVKVALEGFEMRRLTPYVYVPLEVPYRPTGGRLAVALTTHADSDAEGLTRATVAGTARVEREALTAIGRADPFISVNRIDVEVKEADLIGRTLAIGAVTLDTLELKAHRAPAGAIDIVELFTPKGPPRGAPTRAQDHAPAVAATPGAAPRQRDLFPIIQGLARGFERIHVERVTLTPSRATFFDESTRPPSTLTVTDLTVRVDDLTWPPTGPATLALSTGMPGGGTLQVTGPVLVQPLDVNVRVVVKDGVVEPYQGYIPVPALLSGRFNGDSQNHVTLRDGEIRAVSKGRSWARNVAIREPGAREPAIRVDYMDLVGIDFDWPRRASVARAGFRKLRVNVERDADGAMNIRRLFNPLPRPDGARASSGATGTGKARKTAPAPDVLDTLRLDFGEIHLQDGFIRFLDRTTTPAFSQDLSRLDVKVTGFGNQRGRRAKLTLQSAVGGDAGLDIRGEIGPIGGPPFVDLVGELRSFKLPSVDPYAAANIGWVIKKGELQYKVRFLLDDVTLHATNEVVVGQLQVAPAKGGDEVKRRIGLPLGLIVALIKDQQGDIRANVPVEGTVNDPKFDLREAIWTAVKNVLVNIVTAPFKALGRMFSGEESIEEPKVEAVTFAAGSSVLSPAMEEHLLRVADFLRGAPFVSLALRPVHVAADVEALKGEAVTSRLRAFQKERGLSDEGAALAAYYKERLPDVSLPDTLEARVAVLRERESVPETLLAELGKRRLDATRERLVSVEGIPAERLTEADAGGDAPAAEASGGEGRVEFALGADAG
jgi:hypothetical protein